ncbi:MAG TPA: hypothetical protein VHX43_16285 [Xanthobacteraceae bacterium]|jgi:hypothetical protein|nr:hypothetical protein [Xanthobacteraceae bacterium]
MIRPIVIFAYSLFAVAIGPGNLLLRADAQSLSQASPAAAKHKMVSWVVLTGGYVDLSLDEVRQKLDEVYPGQFLPPRQKGNFVIAGPARGQFMIFSIIPGAAGIFLLNNIPGPYTDFSDFAGAISDPSIRSGVAKQCCWLSVDLIHRTTTDEEAYRFIEQVLARVAPADAAFLVDPDKGATIAFGDKVRSRFAKGELVLSSP